MTAVPAWSIALLALLVATACGGNQSDEERAQTSPPAESQPAQPAPDDQKEATTPPTSNEPRATGEAGQPPAAPAAPRPPASKQQPSTSGQQRAPVETPPAVVKPDVAPKPTAAPETKSELPTISSAPQKPTEKPAEKPIEKPAAPQAKASVKDVVVLTGAPLGGVRLQHKLHVERAGGGCTTCHHPSRPQKPATAPQQACSDCHTKVATAPMKTKSQAAFHNPTAQAGTCIDCHKTENAKGKKAPLKCNECHKKENS